MEFPSLIHSQKRDPKTDLFDPNPFWDFISHHPESLHAITMFMGDRGLPASWRSVNGYANHTFVLVNAAGKRTLAKIHIKAQGGVKSLTNEAAEAIKGADPDFLKRDLVEFLAGGGEAKYDFFLQLIPEEDAASLPYNVFDVTKARVHACQAAAALLTCPRAVIIMLTVTLPPALAGRATWRLPAAQGGHDRPQQPRRQRLR